MNKPDFYQDVKRLIIDVLFYTVGSFLYAVSVNCFSVPNNLAPGGVTGLATIIHYGVPSVPMGFMIFFLNIPLLVMAWRLIGGGFTARTLMCLIFSSVVMDAAQPLLPVYQGDMFLVVLIGGACTGVGLGLIFMRGGSTGGTEVVARLLERRYPHIPVGRLMLLIDAFVILLSAVVFHNVECALYAVVYTFVASTLIDVLVYGGAGGKLVLIFSSRHEEIVSGVLNTLQRGVTKLHSQGGYNGIEGEVLVCAVRRTEVYPLRSLVQQLDPSAFLVIAKAEEVLGKGFSTTH